MTSNPKALNREGQLEFAIITSLQDPLQQGRVQISPATLDQVQQQQLPWAKALSLHSQVDSGQNQGSTIESSHSFKVGDYILVGRPTASDQDWFISGHTGTTNTSGQSMGGASYVNSPDNYAYNGDLKTGNTTSAKPKRVQTTYPQNPTWANPGQVTMQLASQPDVRQYFLSKMGQYNMPQLGQQDLWTEGQHINQSPSVGSPVTQVILQQDKTFKAEAQKNNNALQMLQRLRTELNTSNFNNFFQQCSNGTLQTFQSLLSGGGGGISGAGNIPGMSGNLLSAFTSMGNQTVSTNSNQNTQMANTQVFGLNANGQPIYANGTVMPTSVQTS